MKIRISKKKLELSNILFFVAFSIYMARTMITASCFGFMISGMLMRTFDACAVIILLFKSLFLEKFSYKKIVTWFICYAIVVTIGVMHGYWEVLIAFVFVLSAQDIEFEDILKHIVVHLVIWTAIIILSCRVGIIEDYTYNRNVISTISIAHSWGFKYYATLGQITMTLTLIYLYFNRNCSPFKLFLVITANTISFFFHTTNLSYFLTIVIVLVYYLVIRINLINFKKKVWLFWATILPGALCGGTYYLVSLYISGGLRFSSSLLSTINVRFIYSVRALQEYGVHLLGSKVIMYGNTLFKYGTAKSNFYIDSGYIYMLIAYGIVFTVLLMAIYTMVFRYVYMSNNWFIYIWLSAMLIASSVNNYLLDPIYNPIIFLFPQILIKHYRTYVGEKQHKNTKSNVFMLVSKWTGMFFNTVYKK